jgi:hypothetical protein
VKTKATTRPKQQAGDALDVFEIAGRLRVTGGKDLGGKMGNVAVSLFEREPEWDRISRSTDLPAKGAIGQNRGPKGGIQNRRDSGGY